MFILFRYTLYFLGFYVGTMLTLFGLHTYLPNPPQILGFIARSMSAYLSMMACAAYGTIASIILKLLGLEYAYGQWTTAKAFKNLGLYTTGVKFDILDNGLEILNSTRPVVIISNHQTELDVLLLGWIWPRHCSVTAKKSLRNVPFLGWFMTLSGTIFIDRVDRSQAMKAFEGAAKAMKEKQQSVLIFPEGTRSYPTEPMLLPFKKGAFHLAVQAGVPIVPVVAENYSHVLNVKARRFNSGTIRVKGMFLWRLGRFPRQGGRRLTLDLVLDPIPTKDLTPADVDHLTQDTRDKMLNALIAMGRDLQSAQSKKVS
jgi:lysophosphatidate acyltransferase